MGGCVGGGEDKGGVCVVFININDMYNTDVGKGGVRVYEAYEVKQRVALVRVPFYFINLLPTSLLYISILLTCVRWMTGGGGRERECIRNSTITGALSREHILQYGLLWFPVDRYYMSAQCPVRNYRGTVFI
jgi:hypothetical protein